MQEFSKLLALITVPHAPHDLVFGHDERRVASFMDVEDFVVAYGLIH